LGGAQISLQSTLVDALAKSKNLITFAPSEYGLNWTREDYAIPELDFLAAKEKVVHRAKEKGVPITLIQNGGFAEYFEAPFK
jgi:hypothetical protein